MKEILKIVGFNVADFMFAIIEGFVLYVLWGWFIAPLGIFALNFIQSVGVLIVVRFLNINLIGLQIDGDTDKIWWCTKFVKLFLCAGVLLHSWVIHSLFF